GQRSLYSNVPIHADQDKGGCIPPLPPLPRSGAREALTLPGVVATVIVLIDAPGRSAGRGLKQIDGDSQGDGSQEARTGTEESLSFLHQGRVPAAGVRRLQGCANAQETLHQPGQDVFEEEERQLRRLPASRQGRRQARPLHGPAALRRRITASPSGRTSSSPKVR